MNLFSSDELRDELGRIDDTLAMAVRRAGARIPGRCPGRLEAHGRSLRAMLDEDGAAVTLDTIDAAKRVMTAADPAAPLLMLEMARQNLAAVIRRSQRMRNAA